MTGVERPGPVFLDYSQEELDRAYDQRHWVPDADAAVARYGVLSEAARALMPPSLLRYGEAEDETLHLFRAGRAGAAPVQVFVHGGGWRSLSKEDASFPAPTFVGAGAHFVALDFGNMPRARLPEMADGVRRALAWLHREARSFGGDPDRLFVTGHSSGAHLAAVALTTDWAGLGLPATLLKGGLCVSGMYELGPVMLSARRAYVELDDAEIAALSPLRHLDRLACPIAVAWGGRESPEFQRQGRAFAGALEARGRLAARIEAEAADHFGLIEDLADPASPLARAALAGMGLAA